MSYSFYNLTIPDQSPTITYLPFRDGPSRSGWNVSYDQDNTWSTETIAQGSSYHRTTHVGASASHTWNGTGAWVYGSGDVDITCDGIVGDDMDLNSEDNLLGGCLGLDWGSHTITVVANSGEVDLYAIKTQLAFGSGAYITNTSIPTTTGEGSVNTPFALRVGDWEIETDFGGGAGSTTITYDRLSTSTIGADVFFNITQGTSVFMLYGSVNFDHGTYGVIVDDQPPQIFNATSRWASVDQVLYYATVDPATFHIVEVTNTPFTNSSQFFDLSHVIQMQAAEGQAADDNVGSTGLSPGSFAGAMIGAALAALFIAAGVFFLYKRKLENGKWVDEDMIGRFRLRKFRGGEGGTSDVGRSMTIESDRDIYNPTSSAAITPFESVDPFRDMPGVPQRAPDEVYPLASPVHTPIPSPHIGSLTSPTAVSMIITNPDGSTSPAGSGEMLPSPATPLEMEEKARHLRTQVRRPDTERRFRQEQDGGTLDATRVHGQVEIVPPSYDPSWALPNNVEDGPR